MFYVLPRHQVNHRETFDTTLLFLRFLKQSPWFVEKSNLYTPVVSYTYAEVYHVFVKKH